MEYLIERLTELKKALSQHETLVVAASGGTDSTFLAYVAWKELGNRMRAVSVRTAFCIEGEIETFGEFAKRHSISHAIIEVDILKNFDVIKNDSSRCYHCKKEIFSTVIAYARQKGLTAVVDGSNVSDDDDYRPGMKALEELGVISPLRDAGFEKRDIYQAINMLGIDIPFAHPNSCLATRIEYGTMVTPQLLHMIRKGERVIAAMGIAPVRLRYHNGIARIETSRENIQNIINDIIIMKAICEELKALGFQYVTIDLEGYRKGSMNMSQESFKSPKYFT